jgi:hypothetical protein
MAKVKVLVKIFTMENGDEGEILRQFTINGREDTEGLFSIKIEEYLDKKFGVKDTEAWIQGK